MFDLFRDLRFGIRLLRNSPVFTTAAVLLLAVGISAITLIFSVINALLLRPLPVSHPENLVRLVEVHPNDFVTWDLPYDFCNDAASRDTDFSEVFCQGEADVAFSDGTSTERVRIHLVSPNFFSSLGIRPYLGRVLTADDEHARAQNAVLSYDFWQRRLHGDRSVLGKTIRLGGNGFTIVGVSPKAFNGLAVDTSPDLRVPASVDRLLVKPSDNQNPAARPIFAQIFARVRTGESFERASANVDPLLHDLFEQETNKVFPQQAGTAPVAARSHLRLESIANGVSTLRTQFSRSLEILMAGVALLLVMACANVASLLLARSAARAQEIGVRLALGAGPIRIVRQLLTEGVLLSTLGGGAGILLVIACLPLLNRALPPMRDRGAVLQALAVHVGIDMRVLWFAIGVSVLTAVLFALSPAWRAAHTDVRGALKGGRTTTRRLAAGNAIVMVQIGICTLLLMGATLLIETLQQMRTMNPGFDVDRVVTFTIDPTVRGYSPDQIRIFSKALLNRTAALPGVSAVGISSRGVMRGTGVKATFGVAGSPVPAGDFLNSSTNAVTPDYFETMGIRLIAGRMFNAFDRANAKPHPSIVNEAFVRHFFPGKSAIGESFGFVGSGGVATADNQIIGVVSDAKYRSLREPIPPTVYSPMTEALDSGTVLSDFVLNIRTRQNPEALIGPVRQLVRSLDPELPLIETQTLRDEVEASLWQERLLAALATTFGAIAALLAGIGLYGALDYAVKSRTREIGLRTALGAQPARLVAMFSKETVVVTAGGIFVGLCGYAAVSIYLRKVLFRIRPWEPNALVAVLLIVGFIAAIATFPALFRAVRIDPAKALRTE